VVPKHIRHTVTLVVLLTALISPPPARVRAQEARASTSFLPDLQTFLRWMTNSETDQLRGVYAPDLFASPVVQQPAGSPGFVSRSENVLTQFGSAAGLGSTGLLAHNYLAGRHFALMQPAQVLHLVYGDGRIETYIVAHLLRYRALQPNSMQSDFEDLNSGERIGGATLFSDIYGQRGAVVLQTCIASNGSSTWGRLFVIAMPFVDRGGNLR
jgi:hypothetical protein